MYQDPSLSRPTNKEANVFVAGIDAHTRYVVIVVVNKAGERVLGPVKVKVDQPARLVDVLAPYRPLEAVVETSSSWPWLDEVLTAVGVRFVLAHARRLRAIAEANYKRDGVDAELLARMRLAGLIPEVYPTPYSQREWATLIRHRTTLVGQRTALVNRIHAQLHTRGLYLARGRLLTRTGRDWLRTVAWPHLALEQRRLVRTHFRLIAALRPLVRALDRRIAHVGATIPEARLLQGVPGIGPHRALLICAEVLPIARFRTPGHLASYAGLVPRSTQTGLRPVRHGAIPAGANRWLRGALVRAVVSHLQHAPESWLSQYYRTQKTRVGWPTARVAGARKLARALHAMLRTNTRWTSDHREPSEPLRGELQEPHAAR
jgi:transposase